ncbi:hypothetical protein A4D02_28960 [Niastella koreensis]|uniref:Neutral/alkaline non-lysosomal ceramidase N-terminal domain-containing protein n=2 Tax=Niastella koreensis TaxID=354356 RepID=G8T742_NIAKG|nr:hypothetical protein [Niastella koreensis]AEW00067.1 hypothetical protein Niako_3773 [Niastella koreensis GR20-10]OQP49623.1 hypothetical protein A4D02_28960 [Niastella koreensis]
MKEKDVRTIEPDYFKAFFGVAEASINPPQEIYFRNWGASAWDEAIGFHKTLKMQCLAIKPQTGGSDLIMVTADLGWWINAGDEYAIRSHVLHTFQLEESQLLFCLSHTHAGPSICSNNSDRIGGEFILPYLQQLQETMATLIRESREKLVAGTLSWEYGKCNLATNRDLREEDGQSYLVGYNPAEPADDTLLFGHILTEAGEPLCSIVNYACHPTTLAHENRLFSPDFVGEMRDVISSRTKAPCLFLQGASGELSPRVQYVADTAIADAHGRQLAYAALSVYEGNLPAATGYRFKQALPSGAPLAIWEYFALKENAAMAMQKLELEVPLKELPSLEAIKMEWEQCQDRVLKDRLWRKLNTRQVVGNGTKAKVAVWLWKLGDAYMVAQPNETYSYFQQQLRAALPGKKIAVVNIANGYVGYMPDAKFYGKDIYSCNTTPYAAGALEVLTQGVIDAIRNL